MSFIGIATSTVAAVSQTPPSGFNHERRSAIASRPTTDRDRPSAALTKFLSAYEQARFEAREDGIRVTDEARNRLALFVAAYPPGLPLPDPQILDDGRLLLEWSKGPGLSLVLALNNSTKIHFASLIRGAAFNGNANFSGDRLPPEFFTLLKRWIASA